MNRGQRRAPGVLPSVTFLYSSEEGLFPEPGACVFSSWLASVSPSDLVPVPPQCRDYRCFQDHTWFVGRCWDLNSDPHGYTALLVALMPQLLKCWDAQLQWRFKEETLEEIIKLCLSSLFIKLPTNCHSTYWSP